MGSIVQKYYTVAELAWTYGFAATTIREWMRKGLFGPREHFLEVGSDVRVPTSGALFFEEQHKRQQDEQRSADDLVRGRTLGEARRRRASAVGGNGDA